MVVTLSIMLGASMSAVMLPPVPAYAYSCGGMSSCPGGVDVSISTNGDTLYPGITWFRLHYSTCGAGDLSGSALKDAISYYHQQSPRINILLVFCQFDMSQHPAYFDNALQGGADALQCGNEQMKTGFFTYMDPHQYALFFNACVQARNRAHATIPVLLGSVDPLVAGDAQLYNRVNYLYTMQSVMQTTLHQGNWSWQVQIIGLVDSWHNGYRDLVPGTNNLEQMFIFWAQQFNVAPSDIGYHVWVVEATGCAYGCGLDDGTPLGKQTEAISHIITLITDVNMSFKYRVPTFYFSGTDFSDRSQFWPLGILTVSELSKPLRQDLPMGARKLHMRCLATTPTVQDQESLLADMYAGCTPEADYYNILTS